MTDEMPEEIWVGIDRNWDPSVDLHASRTKDYDSYVAYTLTSSAATKFAEAERQATCAKNQLVDIAGVAADLREGGESMAAALKVAVKELEQWKWGSLENLLSHDPILKGREALVRWTCLNTSEEST